MPDETPKKLNKVIEAFTKATQRKPSEEKPSATQGSRAKEKPTEKPK